jgi:hypothetical protein
MGLRMVRAGLDKYHRPSRSSDRWRPRRGSGGGGGRGGRSSWGRSSMRGPDVLTLMRAQAVLKACSSPLGPTSPSACSSATKAFEAALKDSGR